jgi:magnesium-transporting ATPase (P-type)
VHPLALLLWVAAALAMATSQWAIAIAVIAVVLLNAVFAFLQERQAERSVEALAAFIPITTRVVRDGVAATVDAADLVPGDLVLVGEGDRISADARLVSGEIEVDISALTGESAPVPRTAPDTVFSGTLCTSGDARAEVLAGWSPGDPTGPGTPLHGAYVSATTVAFAGIVACQVGTAWAARTEHARLRDIGVWSNPLLLWGIAFELAFLAFLLYVPPVADVFGTAPLSWEWLLLLPFPIVVWAVDALVQARARRGTQPPDPTGGLPPTPDAEPAEIARAANAVPSAVVQPMAQAETEGRSVHE